MQTIKNTEVSNEVHLTYHLHLTHQFLSQPQLPPYHNPQPAYLYPPPEHPIATLKLQSSFIGYMFTFSLIWGYCDSHK